MLNSLFAKISLAVLAIFAVLTILLVSSIDNSARALQEEASQKLYLELAANIVKDSPLWGEGEVDSQAIEDAFHMMMLLGPAIELYVVSIEGQLLNYSDPDGTVVRQAINMAPVQQFMTDNSMLPIVGDDPRSENTQKIFSVAPIFETTLPEGAVASELQSTLPPVAYLYIIIGGENYDSVLDMLNSSHFARLGLNTIGAGAIFFVLVLLLLFFWITRPIKQLSAAMLDFKKAEFLEPPIKLSAADPTDSNELNQLAGIFSEMAERIVSQFNAMIHNKQLRQELISHISHDLKTPLSSIRGYLESWQINNETQNQAESERCIEVALKNCSHLEHMVEQLFELTRLEANDIKPELEVFPLNELVDDIIQKLSLKASEKNIELLCKASSNLPNVGADIGHLNRVFTNLLDNAIRHSEPNSQVLISLQLNSDENMVEVRIADSGTGIPEQELPYLFEPYFKASNQDQHYVQGTGLGLAITRRLLLLHNTDIQVESTENVGSTFSFGLATT